MRKCLATPLTVHSCVSNGTVSLRSRGSCYQCHIHNSTTATQSPLRSQCTTQAYMRVCCSSYSTTGTTNGPSLHASCMLHSIRSYVQPHCRHTDGRMPMTILHHTCTWKKMQLPEECRVWDADDKAAAHAACVLQPCYTHADSSSAEATSPGNMSLSRPSCIATHPQIRLVLCQPCNALYTTSASTHTKTATCIPLGSVPAM